MEAKEEKYLIFSLGEESFGISINKVKEIIGMMEITHIPRTPDFMKGVINLRGKIIPIMDLRLKFGMEEKPYNERTCIIVTEMFTGETKKQMGIAVDMVSEVVNIQKEDIEPPPQYDVQTSKDFLSGIAKVRDKVVLLLKIEQMLSREELTLLKTIKTE